MQKFCLYISGKERLETIEGLSVITEEQPSVATVDTDSASERLVVSLSAAGSLSPNDITRGQETQVTCAQSASQVHSQMWVIYAYTGYSVGCKFEKNAFLSVE